MHIDRSKSYRDLITVHVGGVRAARPLSSDDDPDEADAVRPCTAQCTSTVFPEVGHYDTVVGTADRL